MIATFETTSVEFMAWLQEYGLDYFEGHAWSSKTLAQWIHHEGRVLFDQFVSDCILGEK